MGKSPDDMSKRHDAHREIARLEQELVALDTVTSLEKRPKKKRNKLRGPMVVKTKVNAVLKDSHYSDITKLLRKKIDGRPWVEAHSGYFHYSTRSKQFASPSDFIGYPKGTSVTVFCEGTGSKIVVHQEDNIEIGSSFIAVGCTAASLASAPLFLILGWAALGYLALVMGVASLIGLRAQTKSRRKKQKSQMQNLCDELVSFITAADTQA